MPDEAQRSRDIEHWTLDIGYWTLDIGHLVLDIGHLLTTPHKTFLSQLHLNNMRSRILTLIILLPSLVFGQSKPSVKVYAYAQPVIRGVQLDIVDESGKTVQSERKPSFNYYFFFEQKNKLAVKPLTLWVDGKPYDVQVVEESQTPVRLMTTRTGPLEQRNVELVPKTTNKVFKITPSDPKNIKPSSSLKKLMRNNKVVFSYVYKNKTYFATVKDFNMLEPMAMM